MTVHEFDSVELLVPLPQHGLQPGVQGAVVGVWEEGVAYIVEFYNADWRWTPDSGKPYPAVIATVTAAQIRLVERHEDTTAPLARTAD